MNTDQEREYGTMPQRNLYGLPTTPTPRQAPRGVAGILATLFGGILHDLNINGARLQAKTRKYCDHIKARDNALLAQQPTGYSSMKLKTSQYNPGIWMRAMLSPKMTIKTFVKGLRIIDVVKFELRVTLTHRNGRVTHHTCVADIGADEMEIDEDEETGAFKDVDPSVFVQDGESSPPKTDV
jgi:hypothetical protein